MFDLWVDFEYFGVPMQSKSLGPTNAQFWTGNRKWQYWNLIKTFETQSEIQTTF